MNVLIAMPCYQAQVNVDTAKCIMRLITVLSANGIRCEYFTLNSESLIPRGRNACVAYFLSKDFTHLLFIDADVVFDASLVLTLLNRNEAISGCPYPKKTYQWDNIINATLRSLDWNRLKDDIAANKEIKDIIAHQDSVVNKGDIHARLMSYVYNPLGPEVSITNGWMQVSEIGTGFMLIRRDVIETMKEKFPNMKYINDVTGYNSMAPGMENNFYLFFDCRCEPHGESQRYLSEDYAFCKLAKSLGYNIWLYTHATISHVGSHAFTGNMLQTMAHMVNDVNSV